MLALFVLLTAVAYTVWLERKVVGHMQNRWGPTRVGPFGLLQPLADGVKFLFKEDLTPPHVYKPLYIAAPMIAVVFALTSIAVIPIGNTITIGSLVLSRICSRATPSAYVFPDPLCPHQNVCRLIRLGISPTGTDGSVTRVPTGNVAPDASKKARTAAGSLRRADPDRNGAGVTGPGRIEPAAQVVVSVTSSTDST